MRSASIVGLLVFVAAAPVGAMPHEVDPASIRTSLESAWREVAPPDATCEILALPRLAYDGEDPRVEVVWLEGLERPGPRALAVNCRVGERIVSRGLANVLIRVRRTVWIAPAPLTRGQRLDPSTLLRETRVFEREPRRLFAPVAGKSWQAIRNIEAGAILRSLDVKALPDVEAGSEILLVSRAGMAEVAVVGRARRDGDVGDTILVHNPITGTLVKAVLLDSGRALLQAPEGREER
jgi:flagella basal body P-ring formation protein FlgA